MCGCVCVCVRACVYKIIYLFNFTVLLYQSMCVCVMLNVNTFAFI